MPFTIKDWRTPPDRTTPITAAALEDMETRLSDYTDALSNSTKVSQFGAVGDGITDDTAAIQAALDATPASGLVVIPAGTYIISAALSIPSNIHVLGVGRPTLKMAAGSTANPGLLVVAGRTDVLIEGVILDGNRPNITPFNNVVTIFESTRVVFDRCRWQHTKGIALLFSKCVESGVNRCRFEDIGNEHETTGNATLNGADDRRQAINFFGDGTAASDHCFVRDSYFNHIGLGSANFTGNCTNAEIARNTFMQVGSADPYVTAGQIYVSQTNVFRVIGNYFDQSGGNAIDTINSTRGVIANNIIERSGAAGILMADSNQFITIANNICRNNNVTNLTHKGGITFHAQDAAAVLKHITLTGNLCYDDQGTPTQTFAIGIATGSGTIQRDTIKIDESNVLLNSRFQSAALGGLETWQVIGLTAGATFTVCDNTRRVWVDVVQINATQDARFLVNATVIRKQVDTLGTWVTTDTGTESALYNDAGDNTIKIKNRTAATRSYLIRVSALGNLAV